MIWSDFKSYVFDQLPLDKDRGGAETFIQTQLSNAVRDIQTYIPAFRRGHETQWTPSNFTTHGSASLGKLPCRDIMPAEAWIIREDQDCACQRHPCQEWDWDRRYELIDNQVCLDDNHGLVSFSPHNDARFYVFPAILASQVVDENTYSYKFFMTWDGVREEFNDRDETPFTKSAANAVRLYIKAEIAMEIDDDISNYDKWKEKYLKERTRIYLETLEQRQLK